MRRTTASYKMKLELAKTTDNELSISRNVDFFSWNVDKAANGGPLKKILTYLISLYHPNPNRITV